MTSWENILYIVNSLVELDVLAVGEDDARWTSVDHGDTRLQLDKLAGAGDDAGVADDMSLGSLLHEGSVGHYVGRGTLKEDGDASLFELDGSTIGGDHTRGTNHGSLGAVVKGKSEVVGELDVSAVLGNDARWTNHRNVVDQILAELGVHAVGMNNA